MQLTLSPCCYPVSSPEGETRCRRAELLLLLAVPPANIYQARAVAIAGFHERIKQSVARVVPSAKSS